MALYSAAFLIVFIQGETGKSLLGMKPLLFSFLGPKRIVKTLKHRFRSVHDARMNISVQH